jgi:catechol 2,3-dioxygenase-like lactoylglutathione lyase family enzyme
MNPAEALWPCNDAASGEHLAGSEVAKRRSTNRFRCLGPTTLCPRGRGTTVTHPTLEKAFGYQGDNMNLPVRDLAAALPFYEIILGFQVLSRGDTQHNSAVLARDQVQIGLVENGGDPTQDGCAFHVMDVEGLFAEFKARGLQKESSKFDTERHDGATWKVFYVVAPDGLCYWFGERQLE